MVKSGRCFYLCAGLPQLLLAVIITYSAIEPTTGTPGSSCTGHWQNSPACHGGNFRGLLRTLIPDNDEAVHAASERGRAPSGTDSDADNSTDDVEVARDEPDINAVARDKPELTIRRWPRLSKHRSFQVRRHFYDEFRAFPIAVESDGPVNESAVQFLTLLARKISQQSGDERWFDAQTPAEAPSIDVYWISGNRQLGRSVVNS